MSLSSLPEARVLAVLLPRASALAGQARQLLGGLGFHWVELEKAPSADLVLIDLTPGASGLAEAEPARERGVPQIAIVERIDHAVVDLIRDGKISDAVELGRLTEDLPIRALAALRHGQNLREGRRRARDLDLLLKLTADYAETFDVAALLHDVMRRLAEELEILRASLVIVDPHQQVGVVIAASDDQKVKELVIDLSRYPEIREVIRTGRPVLLEDAPAHALLQEVKQHVATRGIQSIAALPLSVHGNLIGVLLVRGSKGRRPFSASEVALLETVGHATAVALRNVRLLDAERRQLARQRVLAEELKRTKDFLECLINSSVDAIIAADMKGRILLFNTGAEAICGYSQAEALRGLNARDLYPAGGARQILHAMRAGGGKMGVSRREILSKAGVRIPVNITASIIYQGTTELGTVGIFTDLRDWVRLEKRLSVAEQKVEESEKNAAIVALAGAAAHELNQPLTSVMGYAELLKKHIKQEDYGFRPVEIIYRQAERMAEIVKKIGKITRFETKSYVGSTEILDLDKASKE